MFAHHSGQALAPTANVDLEAELFRHNTKSASSLEPVEKLLIGQWLRF